MHVRLEIGFPGLTHPVRSRFSQRSFKYKTKAIAYETEH